MSKNTENIIGYRITTLPIDTCIRLILSWIKGDEKRRYFVCANPHSLVTAQKDDIFHEAIMSADLVIPDGSGIILASRILGGRVKNMITGSDIFRELSHTFNKAGGYSYFFLGSSDTTLKQLKDKMQIDYPNIRVAGIYSPPFKPEFTKAETNQMIETINQSEPDVLWVGMTAPKQEKWVYRNKAKLNVKFIGSVGAVFDFYAGRIKRSHPFFLNYGLEWLPRLLQEPRRLWKRTFISAPEFIFRVLKQKWSS